MEEGVDMGLKGILLIEWINKWGEKKRKYRIKVIRNKIGGMSL